jgi:hypothetical protein
MPAVLQIEQNHKSGVCRRHEWGYYAAFSVLTCHPQWTKLTNKVHVQGYQLPIVKQNYDYYYRLIDHYGFGISAA